MNFNLKKYLLWAALGNFGQAFIQIISLLILVRLLTPDEFGVATLVTMIIGFFRIFSEMGIGAALVNKTSLTSEDVLFSKGLVIMFTTLICLVLLSATSVVESFLNKNNLGNEIVAASIVILFYGLYSINEALLKRKSQFKRLTIVGNISYFCAYILVAIPLAHLNFGFWALVAAQITLAIMLYTFTTNWKNIFQFKLSIKKSYNLLSYGGGFSLARLANFLANEGDSFVIAKTLNTELLGFYGRAFQLVSLPANLIGSTIERVYFPHISSFKSDINKVKITFQIALNNLAAITIPASSFIYVNAEYIILLMFGDQWLKAIPILQILSTSLFFRVGYKMAETLLNSVGRVYMKAVIQFIYAAVVIIGSIIGLAYGIKGVAVGVTIAVALNYLIMIVCSNLYIKFNLMKVLLTQLIFTVVSYSMSIYILQPINAVLNTLELSAFVIISINVLITGTLILALLFITHTRINRSVKNSGGEVK